MASEDHIPELASVEEHQLWFGPEDRPLFGWLAVPASGRAEVGVVLCSPMAEEGRAGHRTFRDLALRLAAKGALALRFDYDGTGDSAGLLSDADRLSAWTASIEAAAQVLWSCGVEHVSAVGMRLGATLAASVGATSPWHSLALWDPCLSGRAFLREGQALHALGGAERKAPPRGAVDTPGFRFTAETAAELKTLDLAALASNAKLATRSLILVRDDRPLAESSQAQIAAGPTPLDWAVAYGQRELLDVLPSDSHVPLKTLTDIADWLTTPHTGVGSTLTLPESRTAEFRSAELPAPVRERVVSLGPAQLFGVVSESDSVAGAPWLVLVNVAAEHHIGPGRQWVELARQWAALGFRVVRLDQSGVGDSPTGTGQRSDVTFAPEWIDELPPVIEELAADGVPVAMVGLCSGAYSALEAALRTKVDAICAFNPRLTIREAAKGTDNFVKHRRAARPPAKPIARLARRHPLIAGGIWRIYRQFAFWHAPLAVISEVVGQGTDVLIVANRKDGRAFREVALWTLFRLPLLRRTGRYKLLVLDEIDHSLLTQASQLAARQQATIYLTNRYATGLKKAR